MLKSGDHELIQQTFNRLRSEAKGIISSIVQLCWYMRGSIQYHDMMQMSFAERDIVREFIDKHMEAIKKHPSPIY